MSLRQINYVTEESIMADFNDIRKLATEKAGEIAEKTKVVAKTAV